MTKVKLGIKEKYSYELLQIQDKITQLENGRVQEISRANMDGSLNTVARNLDKMIKDLIEKIDNQLPSTYDKIDVLFDKKE
ncbi:hypothetical protein [Planococcus plakortidis]|uniref:hypothetical protein n=1 Tax=Planococcus plakortidis TaxID=1038856 RepID=UPI003859BC25